MRTSAYGSLILSNWAQSGKGLTAIETELENLMATEDQDRDKQP
jgi:hypothetical protein